MKYQQLVEDILKNIGGSENIGRVTHCMTRLRFNLKDDSKASVDAVKNISGVVGCVNKGGQFQVIIGPHVEQVFNTMTKTVDIKESEPSDNEVKGKKKNPIAMLFDIIASISQPIIGALAGAGMIKALLAVLVALKWITTDSQLYVILFMISDVVFYFMPFFFAVSTSKKLNTNIYISLIFAGMLLHPTLIGLKTAGDPVSFLGLPITLATYSSSLIPIIMIVYFQSVIEKWAKKISPDAVKIFLVPMLTILIVAPIGLIAIGPIGVIVGNYVGQFFQLINTYASWLVPALVGGLAPLLVMTGMHYALGSAQAIQRASVGYGTFLTPGMLSSNMSQAAATLAVSLKTKDKNLKSLASSTSISAFCGITEPALYGVTLKLKTPLYTTMAAGAIAGLYGGISGIKAWSAGTSNVFSLPIYIGVNDIGSFYNAIITAVIAIVLGFVLTFIFYKDPVVTQGKLVDGQSPTKESTPTQQQLTRKIYIQAPLEGKVVKLKDTDDEAFSSGAMGKGVAIIPTNGKLVSPVEGEINAVYKTKHAIGIKSVDGVELLIHIGVDTVKLKGEHFIAHVAEGDKIQIGDPLVTFDLEAIKKAGYEVTTPIIVTNSLDYLDVVETSEPTIKQKETLLTVI
jgi:PTS system beta-glucosides-specific IIC component